MTTIDHGAGAFGAGLGPAGYDVAEAPSGSATADAVTALFFDPYNRVWGQNADKTMVQGAGPIQQAAILLMPRGALPSTSSNGLDVASIRAAAPDQRPRVVADAVRAAWSPLLNAGKVAIRSIDLDPSASGRWNGAFSVDVVDLITNKNVVLSGNVSRK